MNREAILTGMSCRSFRDLACLLDSSLTERQKQYLLLYLRDGMRIREIARCCGVAPSTVSRTVSRAAKRLRHAAEVSSLMQTKRSRLS